MGSWVALLRGVNVGGNNRLSMDQLRALGERSGFGHVQTYIASGNLVFTADGEEADLRDRLDNLIEQDVGKRLGVILRGAGELAELVTNNPFPDAPGNKVVAILCDDPLSLDGVKHQADEELTLANRAIYVFYPSGQGRSRLVIPAIKQGTARNMNTLAKLAEMAVEA